MGWFFFFGRESGRIGIWSAFASRLRLTHINKATIVLDIGGDTTIGQIKAELNAGEYVLSFGGRILDDDEVRAGDLQLAHGSMLDINARLLGGKVHGSLARAGKVRSQTPKVEKKEKKKKKTGRSARRIQYNRRFVNVGQAKPGRKRGPNSNSSWFPAKEKKSTDDFFVALAEVDFRL